MNPTLKNILAVIAGVVVGSVVNGLLIEISPSIIPPPTGADVTSMVGLQKSLPLFEPKHFIFPFLAHALGTCIGAYIACKFGAAKSMINGIIVGSLFLIGGIANIIMLPSPLWFSIVDIVFAYGPMAFIGSKLALNHSKSNIK